MVRTRGVQCPLYNSIWDS